MTSEDGLALINSVKSVSRETQERLTVFHDLLRQWQPRINLIAPSTYDHIWERHIADSMQVCSIVSLPESVVDIGSGAGFPGLVYGILMAERGGGRLELIESSGKKCAFMNAVVRDTGLKRAGVDVIVHNARIEAALSGLEQPKIVSARALASLNDLLGLTECFLGEGSIGVFPKGREHSQEIEVAQKNWDFDWVLEPSRFDEGSVIAKISNLKAK